MSVYRKLRRRDDAPRLRRRHQRPGGMRIASGTYSRCAAGVSGKGSLRLTLERFSRRVVNRQCAQGHRFVPISRQVFIEATASVALKPALSAQTPPKSVVGLANKVVNDNGRYRPLCAPPPDEGLLGLHFLLCARYCCVAAA